MVSKAGDFVKYFYQKENNKRHYYKVDNGSDKRAIADIHSTQCKNHAAEIGFAE